MKDKRELFVIVEDMADHLPIEDPNKGAEHELRDGMAIYFNILFGSVRSSGCHSVCLSVRHKFV